jgi:hypothetical protein
MPVILATCEAEIRRIMVQSQLRKIVCEPLPGEYSTQKRAGRVAEVVECLPSKSEDLSSNPSIIKKFCEFLVSLIQTSQQQDPM